MKKVRVPTDLLAAALSALEQKLQVQTAYGKGAQNIASLKALLARTNEALGRLIDDSDPLMIVRAFRACMAHDQAARRNRVKDALSAFAKQLADNKSNGEPSSLDALVITLGLLVPKGGSAIGVKSGVEAIFPIVRSIVATMPSTNKFMLIFEAWRWSEHAILCGAGIPPSLFNQCKTIGDLFDAITVLLICEAVVHESELSNGDGNDAQH